MGEIRTRLEAKDGPDGANWDWLIVHNPLHKHPRLVGVPKGDAAEIACRVITQPTLLADLKLFMGVAATKDMADLPPDLALIRAHIMGAERRRDG